MKCPTRLVQVAGPLKRVETERKKARFRIAREVGLDDQSSTSLQAHWERQGVDGPQQLFQAWIDAAKAHVLSHKGISPGPLQQKGVTRVGTLLPTPGTWHGGRYRCQGPSRWVSDHWIHSVITF